MEARIILQINQYYYYLDITIKSIQNLDKNYQKKEDTDEFLNVHEICEKIVEMCDILNPKLQIQNEDFDPKTFLILVNFIRNILFAETPKNHSESLTIDYKSKILLRAIKMLLDFDEQLFRSAAPGVLSSVFKIMNTVYQKSPNFVINAKPDEKNTEYNFSIGANLLISYFAMISSTFSYSKKPINPKLKIDWKNLSSLKKDFMDLYKNNDQIENNYYKDIISKINEYLATICKNYSEINLHKNTWSKEKLYKFLEDSYYGFSNLLNFSYSQSYSVIKIVFITDENVVLFENIWFEIYKKYFFLGFQTEKQDQKVRELCAMVLSQIGQSPNMQKLVQDEINILNREIIKIVLYSNVSLTNSEISSKSLIARIINLSHCFLTKTITENKCHEIIEQILELFITVLTITKENNCLNTISRIEFSNEKELQSIDFFIKTENLMIKELGNFFIASGNIDSGPILKTICSFFKDLDIKSGIYAQKIFFKKLINLLENIISNPEITMISKLKRFNKAYLLNPSKKNTDFQKESGLKELIKSNIHKFCGFEDIPSYLFIINKILDKIIKSDLTPENEEKICQIINLFSRTYELLDDKHLNYFIAMPQQNKMNHENIKDLREKMSIQTFFCTEKWYFCYLGTFFTQKFVEKSSELKQLEKNIKYQLIQFALTISCESIYMRKFLNNQTVNRLCQIFNLEQFDLFAQIHAFVLNKSYINLINSYTKKDILYNATILENGLSFIIESIKKSQTNLESVSNQNFQESLDNIYGILLKIFEFLVAKNYIGSKDFLGMQFEYQKDTTAQYNNSECQTYYKCIILIMDFLYTSFLLSSENEIPTNLDGQDDILGKNNTRKVGKFISIPNFEEFLNNVRVLAQKLCDFLSLESFDISESALKQLKMCLFITKNKRISNDKLYSENHKLKSGNDISKLEYLTTDGTNVEIPNLGGVIFYEIFSSLSYLLKVVLVFLTNKNITVKIAPKRTFEIYFNEKITENKLEFIMTDKTQKFQSSNLVNILKANLDLIKNEVSDCENDLWGKNLVLMNQLADIMKTNFESISKNYLNSDYLELYEPCTYILLVADYDSMDGQKFIESILDIHIILTVIFKEHIKESEKSLVAKNVMSYLQERYHTKHKYMTDNKEYTSSLILVNKIIQKLKNHGNNFEN